MPVNISNHVDVVSVSDLPEAEQEADGPVRVKACTHIFHNACLRQYVSQHTEYAYKCPICRTKIFPEGQEPLLSSSAVARQIQTLVNLDTQMMAESVPGARARLLFEQRERASALAAAMMDILQENMMQYGIVGRRGNQEDEVERAESVPEGHDDEDQPEDPASRPRRWSC